MFPSCRATTMEFVESSSRGEKAICSAMNHSGSAIVPAKPASLVQSAWRLCFHFWCYSQGQRLENCKNKLRNGGKYGSHLQYFRTNPLLGMKESRNVVDLSRTRKASASL
jgi:hypothetical protein